jgi:hypothetical protein
MRENVWVNISSNYKPTERRVLGGDREFWAEDLENLLLEPFKEETLFSACVL